MAASKGEAVVDQLVTLLDGVTNPTFKRICRIPFYPGLGVTRPLACVYVKKARPAGRSQGVIQWEYEIYVECVVEVHEDGDVTASVDELRDTIETALDTDRKLNNTCTHARTEEWHYEYSESESFSLCAASCKLVCRVAGS